MHNSAVKKTVIFLLIVFISGAAIAAIVVSSLFSHVKYNKKLSRIVHNTKYLEYLRKASSLSYSIGKKGGALYCVLPWEPASLNPIVTTDPLSEELLGLMFEGLVRVDHATAEPVANLARQWEFSDDGRRLTFWLRKNLLWSDSTPLTAFDVEFTFDSLIYNKKFSSFKSRSAIYLPTNGTIEVTAIDSHTVVFELSAPMGHILYCLAVPVLPKHKYLSSVIAGTFNTMLTLRTAADTFVVNGPFILTNYVPSQLVIFKKNPFYWKTDSAQNHLPYLDSIVYRVCSERFAEQQLMLKGEIDYCQVSTDLFAELAWNQPESQYQILRLGPSAGSNCLVFNQNSSSDSSGKPYVSPLKQSYFRSVYFRKAIAHCINKDSIIMHVFGGMGYPQWSPISQSQSYYYNDAVTKYTFDTLAAKLLLEKVGISDKNNDKLLEDQAGNHIEFTILVNRENDLREKIAYIISNNLLAIGFNVTVQSVSFEELQNRLFNPPFDWDAALIGLTDEADPYFCSNIWYSWSPHHIWFPSQTRPSTQWEASIDSLFEQASKHVNKTERKKLFDAWQRIATENVPLIYTVTSERIICVSNRLRNFKPSFFAGALATPEFIYIDK